MHKKIVAVDCDGNITLADSLEVLRYSVGLPTKSNVREIFLILILTQQLSRGDCTLA